MNRYVLFIILATVATLTSAQYDWDKITFDPDSDSKESRPENVTTTTNPKENEVRENAPADSSAELSDRFLLAPNGNGGAGQYAQNGNAALIPSMQNFMWPHFGLLELAQVFLRLVGEIWAKVQEAFFANRFLLRDSIDFLTTKLAKMHTFVVNGVAIVRRVLQFALELFSHWSMQQRPPLSQAQQWPSQSGFDGGQLSMQANYPHNYGNNWGASPVGTQL